MAIVRYKLDPANPLRLTPEEIARLDTMTPEEIEANALSDPDNPPLTEEELARMGSARVVRDARAATGLSQTAFAKRFHINPARLRDLEQGRTKADSAVLAYLTVILRERGAVERALGIGEG